MEVRAAGGVVWRPAGSGADSADGLEVAVVRRPKYGDWSLPKGKLDPDETWLQAAVREVAEETGLSVEVGRYLGEVEYLDATVPPRRKVVRYWAMRAVAGTFTPHAEIDQLRWLPPPEALRTLSYDRDRSLLRSFLAGDPR